MGVAVRRESGCQQLAVAQNNCDQDSQGTWYSVDRGLLVPTELVTNTLTVGISPLVKFWFSWLISADTQL